MAKPAFPKITYVTLSADESIHPKYEAALRKFAKELGPLCAASEVPPCHNLAMEITCDERNPRRISNLL